MIKLKKLIISYFLIFTCFFVFAQDKDLLIHKTVKDLRFLKRDININFQNDTLKGLFHFLKTHQDKGLMPDSLIVKKGLNKLKGKIGVIANYVYGDYLIYKNNPNDSLSFHHYKQGLKLSKKLKDTLLINECLRRICNNLFGNAKDLSLYKDYIKEYNSTSIYYYDSFWAHYHTISYKLLVHLNSNTDKNSINYRNLDFDTGFELAKDSDFLTGIIHQLRGIYFDVFTTDYSSAKKDFRKAVSYFEKEPNFYSKKRIYGNKVNIGIVLMNQDSLNKSIKFFNESLNLPSYVYNEKDRMDVYTWLDSIYTMKGDTISAYKYSKIAKKLQDRINKNKHSLAIKSIDTKAKVDESNKKINALKSKNEELKSKIYTITPFLLIFAIGTLIFFFFYNRYKKRSENLVKNQSETLQKLDELKSIVIKNHIILKDKTKIYISDLLYIKSDDHYLNVFLSNHKNHFVRGKLSQIKEELPPNFIQCHRSYIVNSNFIKKINSKSLTLIDKTEIPLSRSYKDKF